MIHQWPSKLQQLDFGFCSIAEKTTRHNEYNCYVKDHLLLFYQSPCAFDIREKFIANARFKLRISQNRKYASKNRSKKLVWN